MKNCLLQMLHRLKLVAHKQDPCVSADATNFMSSSISERLINDERWQMLEDVNDADFDVSKPIAEELKDAGYKITHFNLTDGGSIHHIPDGGTILFRGKR